MSSLRVIGLSARHGSTLLDVAAGSAILSLLLIPALGMMGRSNELTNRMAVVDTMLFEANRLMESTKITLCDPTAFAKGAGARDEPLDVDGTDRLRGVVTVQPDASISGLLTIDVTVFQDSNRSGGLDTHELRRAIRTQWSQP